MRYTRSGKVEIFSCLICEKPFYRLTKARHNSHLRVAVSKARTVTCSKPCYNIYIRVKRYVYVKVRTLHNQEVSTKI